MFGAYPSRSAAWSCDCPTPSRCKRSNRRPEGSGGRALRPPAAMGRNTWRTSDRTARDRIPSAPPHFHLPRSSLIWRLRWKPCRRVFRRLLRRPARDQDADQRNGGLQHAPDQVHPGADRPERKPDRALGQAHRALHRLRHLLETLLGLGAQSVEDLRAAPPEQIDAFAHAGGHLERNGFPRALRAGGSLRGSRGRRLGDSGDLLELPRHLLDHFLLQLLLVAPDALVLHRARLLAIGVGLADEIMVLGRLARQHVVGLRLVAPLAGGLRHSAPPLGWKSRQKLWIHPYAQQRAALRRGVSERRFRWHPGAVPGALRVRICSARCRSNSPGRPTSGASETTTRTRSSLRRSSSSPWSATGWADTRQARWRAASELPRASASSRSPRIPTPPGPTGTTGRRTSRPICSTWRRSGRTSASAKPARRTRAAAAGWAPRSWACSCAARARTSAGWATAAATTSAGESYIPRPAITPS